MSLKLYEQESHLPVVSRNICRAAYALINSFILNSIGMGSGVIVNVLLYQMLEAALIGLFFHTKHAKKTYAAIIVYILLFSAFDATLLKAFSYILYYTCLLYTSPSPRD